MDKQIRKRSVSLSDFEGFSYKSTENPTTADDYIVARKVKSGTTEKMVRLMRFFSRKDIGRPVYKKV